MNSFPECIKEYRAQLKKGAIQLAYRGLLDFVKDLRIHFMNKHPDYEMPGSVYQGYMDMTYFPLFPKAIKAHKLKIAIVFLHEAFRFEVWLSGVNRQVQKKYWDIFNRSGWDKHRIVTPTKGVDSIIEHILVDNPDFGDLTMLTQTIDIEVLKFIRDIENFLSRSNS
jgi:hypothetical protein